MHPNNLHFLLPFSLSVLADGGIIQPSELAQSACAKLLRRATLNEAVRGAEFQRVLPHESWLARCFEIPSEEAENEQAPFAPYMLLADGGIPGTARWTCIQPVHLQIARDHLVLSNPTSLELNDDEALSLLEAAQPAFTAFNLSLAAPTPLRWYVAGEALGEWLSASPLRASGRNIEIWLPTDKSPSSKPNSNKRAWLKLQNEVQMIWFDHPVNQARAARGLPPVNSIWLYAQGILQSVVSPFQNIFSNAIATRGLALAAKAQVAALPSSFSSLDLGLITQKAETNTLVELDHLIQPWIQQDQTAQYEAFKTLERDWFGPALHALQNGALPSLTLTLSGETELITVQVSRSDLRKFWRRRSLASLIPS